MLSLAIIVALAAQAGMPPEPPRILQIVREPLKTGREAEFNPIEREIAHTCAALKCPHPYLAVESLTGRKEVWFFNGYASAAEVKKVAADYATNTAVTSALEKLGKRKATLIEEPIEYLADYKPDARRDMPWLLGQGRFLMIAVTTGESHGVGTVFESADGTRFTIAAFRNRHEAEAAAGATGPDARLFAVRPDWSLPAEEWIAFDPEFWKGSGFPRFAQASRSGTATPGT